MIKSSFFTPPPPLPFQKRIFISPRNDTILIALLSIELIEVSLISHRLIRFIPGLQIRLRRYRTIAEMSASV